MTPLRVILEERLLKSPDFGALFNHILRRMDELAVQHAEGVERSLEERQRLWELANRDGWSRVRPNGWTSAAGRAAPVSRRGSAA